MEKELFYKIEADGMTVERFLRRQGYSRALITTLKHANDGLTVANTLAFTTRPLYKEDILRVRLKESGVNRSILPATIPLDIVFEDDDLIVINKPAGMPIHPSHGNRNNSLANALCAMYEARGEPFVFRPIGRLDKNTTGLSLLAKHALSACLLSERTDIQKVYYALCQGEVPIDGVIDKPIGRAENSAIKREVRPDGDRAITHFMRISYSNGLSFVRLRLDTGRTHQIRVHMAHLGCPLVGDFLYNPHVAQLERHALHAGQLLFTHPLTKQQLTFTAPLPSDMRSLLSSYPEIF